MLLLGHIAHMLLIVPLTNYANNEVYEGLWRLNKIYTDTNERVFLDLRRGQGYTSEREKISWNHSNLLQTVTLSCSKENEIKGNWLLPWWIYVYSFKSRYINIF